MNHIRTNTLTVVVVCTLVAGCGDDSTTTVGPTPGTTVHVGGTWRGSTTLTAVDGGGCVGIVLSAGIGGEGSPFEATIEQTEASLRITTLNGVNQERCTYSGTVSGNSVAASLSSCTPQVLALGPTCARAGDPRDWTKETLSVQFSGTVDGDVLTGTASETVRVMSDDESHEVNITADLMLTR